MKISERYWKKKAQDITNYYGPEEENIISNADSWANTELMALKESIKWTAKRNNIEEQEFRRAAFTSLRDLLDEYLK